jgi:superfamily II DNA or RNA helicase
MLFDKAEVLKLFPGKFREHQKETLEQTIDLYNCGYKCVVLEMPPGAGKSVFNITMGNAATNALYLTPQKTLVHQVATDHLTRSSVSVIMGRQNYLCPKDPYGELTVDVGPASCMAINVRNVNIFVPTMWRSRKLLMLISR